MRKTILSLAVFATIFTACSSDDDYNGPVDPTDPVGEDIELTGNITEDMTLDATKTYILSGRVHVKDGVTLTIPAGMTIECEAGGTDVYLAVERGGKLIAEGTAAKPIVFTSKSDNPVSGDWGGIVICGKAKTNKGTDVQTEIAGITYGGTNDADNSGSLRYVRAEYTGAKIDGESEFNGFTFYAVGNQTTMENLQVYKGKDDGFEWFGGTVGGKNLVAIDAEDDSFDWAEGWTGEVTNLYSKQTSTSSSDDSRGIEADSNKSNPTAAPISAPTLTNVTLIGRNNGNVTSEAGMYLRRGTKGTFTNVFLKNFVSTTEDAGVGIFFDGTETQDYFAANKVNTVEFDNVTTKSNIESSVIEGDNTGAGSGADLPTWAEGWTK
ncbi:hypothetical protein [Aureivirga marina]|uniref:hypothetical protein n=1 Tax=Aureivirga marina TaxID=1182451 RepID=UPI0018CB5FB1|nr:hypothetical protein [Aureivirga marina]